MSSEEVFVFPTSFAQQRLWFLDQLIPGNTIYNVPTVIRLTGSLNLTALEQTFNEIVRRHESLRTTFITLDGQPLQAIAPSLTIPISVLDLQELPGDQQEIEAKYIITAEIERPFSLSSEPLLRVIILVLSQAEHILLLNIHHIICDDWSIGVLIREIGTLYTAYLNPESNSSSSSILLELPLQYADFAHWQREWLQGEVLETQLAYWRDQLNGISILHLPTNKPRPAIQSYQGATQFLELPKELIDALEKLSQEQGVTLFMTLLAAFQTLLYRYTHQEDIAVGSPIANRNRSEIEEIIGFFVNSLVLRSDLSGNPTFRELLARVREVTLGAYSHQDLPFEKLVEELHPERNLSYHPLFQVVFGLQNSPMSALQLPGLLPSFINIDFKKTRFDLEMHLWKCSEDFRSLWGGNWKYSEGLRGLMVYNTDLFDKATINRMLKHFKTLLSGVVENPAQKIGSLPLLSEEELHQVLVEWNNTQADYPQDKCVHQLFEEKVKQYPDSVAVEFDNKQLTYQELNTCSNKLAQYLQKIGVSSEAFVGICISQSVEMIIGLLGILKAGGVYVPLDPSYPQERLNFMLEDAQVSVLLTHESFLKHFEGFSSPIICIDKDWELINQEKEYNTKSNLSSDNLAYVIYTSGSTGQPKGVAVTHKAINRLVCNTNYITLSPGDKISQASNTSFDAATFEIWGALLNGAQLVGVSKDVTLSPRKFASQLREKDINVVFLTTALFQLIVRDIPEAFSSLKYLLFGGETVDTRWIKKILNDGAPKHLIHVYGPTENTTFSSYYYVEELPESATSFPIGRPITNTQIYILDTYLQPVPIGVTGELYLGGDGLAREYLRRTELTTKHFVPNSFSNNPKARLYKTGDLARYRPDGNIEFLGRVDNQVKIRGFRIELSEIEAVLSQHPAVKETVVTAGEDVPDDKYLVAYIVPHQEQIVTREAQNFAPSLREFLKEKLPEYMLPRAYMVLESLPLTPNGKVDRRALPMPDTISFNNQDYVAPRSHLEELLAEIWAKVLGKEQVGVHDNFFELGGHSLLATRLTSRIREMFQIDLSVRNLFETPTVEQLAKYIDTIRWVAKDVNRIETTEVQREDVEF
ncbi:non-ribosomal peptide synthetase [Aetokthonos hydrillicola Thurmond2011]|jgi:amino acid adenylation domain-containing protein|uniref:Non-ribosomal peptide synthetase n=1 Tax=Aetokthonos hydrillicola Thurmond2011 TaxID=2712845 RepID=A0AAP5I545_9CYAN|nr:non-ribosomal peptide synthetase [Aetokthonos hydrillicola]MBO3458248.1 amino acid adenylation domain-containing protein [Aetokthonos hydrillicola CCALA 1050]MBW4586709.1 amino acid adenylation domain-containing protein [Aetokthonos hydrillicola CCALA 1050]MDR9893964.1 non-ribosomal peptide synthetase [Aetokthonos hydrillicola Thurmond2011]